MARVRFQANIAGFAALRSDPKLVREMESRARTAADGAGVDLDVVTWPHQGRSTGPRTSVQIWARSYRARRAVSDNPNLLPTVLARTGFEYNHEPLLRYTTSSGRQRTATAAQIRNWNRGRSSRGRRG